MDARTGRSERRHSAVTRIHVREHGYQLRCGKLQRFQGKAIPVTGKYNVWAVENIFYYVFDGRVFGGNYGMMILFPTPATGSLVADIANPSFPNLGATAGGSGLADLWIQPFSLGWHFKRADLQVMDAFMVPTGRYSPGASNNVGSGYFGNHLQTGTTFYITKNKGTSGNLFTDWEVHGPRQGTNNTYKTPGQAFSDEWGVGQVLPLKKDLRQLLQVGVIGYDQWQITANGGTFALGTLTLPASTLPYYSVHAVGGQLNYIHPATNLLLLQVRARVQVILTHLGEHDRLRRQLDPAHPETGTGALRNCVGGMNYASYSGTGARLLLARNADGESRTEVRHRAKRNALVRTQPLGVAVLPQARTVNLQETHS